MVDRLTTLDAGFLHAEDADPHTKLGIGGLAVLEGPKPDHAELMSTLGERIAVCPRFAQRLRRRVFDLSAPEWVDDDRFALAHHIRRIAVPAPGTDEDLFTVVAEVMSWRLDRNRPLWEIWIIEGLADDRWAMLMKVHPCLADGIATVHILTGLSDDGMEACATGRRFTGPAGPAADQARRPLHPAPQPPAAAAWVGTLRSSAQLATGALGAVRQTLRASGQVAAGLLRPVSSLNGPIAARRRYGAARVALDDVRQICRAFDTSVSDVALAALTESYRNVLLSRGEQPRADSLRTLVPLSLPTGHPAGNRHALMLPYLPVDQDNPVLRLRMVHSRLARAKSAAVADRAAGIAAAAARAVPFPVAAFTMNLLARLPQRNVVTLAVTVPGPRQPLRVLGRDVQQVLPVPPIGVHLRTGVTILRYADELFFGILADFDTVADIDELARGVETAVARLLVRSKRRRRSRDRHGLSLVVNS